MLAGCQDPYAIKQQIADHNDGFATESDSGTGASTGFDTGPGSGSTDAPTDSGSDSDGNTNALPTIDRFLVNGSASPSKLTNYGNVKLRLEASDPEGDFLEVEFFKDGESLGTAEGEDGVFTTETPIYTEPSCSSQPDIECNPAFTFTAIVTHRGMEKVPSEPIDLAVELPESRTVAWEYRLHKFGYGSSRATSVAFDKVGYLYATGSIINDETGREQLWLGKYSLHGQEMWFQTIEPSLEDEGLHSRGWEIVVDSENNLVVAGDKFTFVNGDELVPFSSWLLKFRGADGSMMWENVESEGLGESTTAVALRQGVDPELGYEIVVVGNLLAENDGFSKGFVRVLDSDGSELREAKLARVNRDIRLTSVYVHDSEGAVFAGGYVQNNSMTEGYIQKLRLEDLSEPGDSPITLVYGADIVTDIAVSNDRVLATGHAQNQNLDLTYGVVVRADNKANETYKLVYTRTMQPPADESINAIDFDDKVVVLAGNRSYNDGESAESISFFPENEVTFSDWDSTWDHFPGPIANRDRAAYDIQINPTSDFVVIAGGDRRREDISDEVAVLVSVVR